MSPGSRSVTRRLLAFARHYGVTVHTCEPADPASKGGSESTVKLAKADLVPKDTNLLPAYGSFAELETACAVFCEQVNTRVHRVTRRAPVDMLAEEQARLHRLPAAPHTVAFGVTRTVAAKTPMVAFEGGQYSVPHPLLGQPVWVRAHGVGAGEQVDHRARRRRAGRSRSPATGGPRRAAHGWTTAISRPRRPVRWTGHPKARTAAEAEFLALGDGARLWLTEAAAAGTSRMRVKMADAVATAKLVGGGEVDWALGHAAVNARFGEADLASILDHHARTQARPDCTAPVRTSLDPRHRRLGRPRRRPTGGIDRSTPVEGDRSDTRLGSPHSECIPVAGGVPAAPPLPG